MRLAQQSKTAFAAATLVFNWRGVTAQNTTGKSPVDYVDPLIGTINGGMAVRTVRS